MPILLLLIGLTVGAVDLRAQGHGTGAHGEAHASEPAAPAKTPTAPAKDHGTSAKVPAVEPEHPAPGQTDAADPKKGGRPAPKPASSAELDAVLQRISQKIAARSGGSPARTAPASSHVTPVAASASKSRITLEWRPSVVWPINLKPAAGDDHVAVDWPAIVN